MKSPPSRGAWIEMISTSNTASALAWSPPSRGAWIEIPSEKISAAAMNAVAPLAGGVD